MWINSIWPSAISSRAGGVRVAIARRRGRRPAAVRRLLAAGAVVVWTALAGAAQARVYATQQEALARLMPPPLEIARRTAYLTEEQARRVEKLCGEKLEYRVVPYYVGTLDGRATTYAFTDTHLVRTLPESVLFALEPDGRIRSTEILSFDEPQDYLPGPRWLQQLEGRPLDERLSLKRDIRTLSGATLSARAATAAARRVLALFQVIVGEPGGRP